MTEPKKLIEVAMPVKEVSAESVRDKSIRHGHISTLHLWWVRRPLNVCRALTIEQQTNGVVSIMFAHQSTEAWIFETSGNKENLSAVNSPFRRLTRTNPVNACIQVTHLRIIQVMCFRFKQVDGTFPILLPKIKIKFLSE